MTGRSGYEISPQGFQDGLSWDPKRVDLDEVKVLTSNFEMYGNHRVIRRDTVYHKRLILPDFFRLQIQTYYGPSNRYDTSPTDLELNSWNTVHMVFVHITPKSKTMKGPHLVLFRLVCTIHTHMCSR